jgi:tRNA(Ile)-lysidine synthase
MLVSRIRQFARRQVLWHRGTRVVAAVSGGADSVAMLFLLHDLHAAGELRLDCIAHLNHQIRSDAPEDVAFCKNLAERLHVPFVSLAADVPAIARERKQSVELAGRVARHRFLEDVRRSRDATSIATAHTEDDQAETTLLRLFRGAGARGLAGIAPRRQHWIRPVLCVTRAELRGYLVARRESWREDSTNAEFTTPRNRVRHELLPYLERHFNPAVRRALARSADIARADNALLTRLSAAASVRLVEHRAAAISLDPGGLIHAPEGLARRVVGHALAALGSPGSFEDINAVLEVVRGDRRGADLPRARVEHFGTNVVLVHSRGGQSATPPRESFCLELPVPGAVQTADGWRVEARQFERPQRLDPRPDVAQIDAALVAGSLSVRNRRPGDRLRPVGAGGSRKLQDVLVDRKVSRRERDALPIVTDTEGRIVWVAGHVLDAAFRVTEGTKAVIILNLRRI